MHFAKVIRKLQLSYHAASREPDPETARAHRETAAALADAHGIPAEITDGLQRLANENTSPHPVLYTPPRRRA